MMNVVSELVFSRFYEKIFFESWVKIFFLSILKNLVEKNFEIFFLCELFSQLEKNEKKFSKNFQKKKFEIFFMFFKLAKPPGNFFFSKNGFYVLNLK
jgi:hypothetical protein